MKSRAHTRLASLGRIHSRGSIQQQQHQPASPGETLSAPVPVSPSDAGNHKPSDTSTLSNSSSETALTDDSRSDTKSTKERPSRPSFWLASRNVPGQITKHYDGIGDDAQHFERPGQHRPRMMHQTSSKLLRMTEDDRPFTRVRTRSLFFVFAFVSHKCHINTVLPTCHAS